MSKTSTPTPVLVTTKHRGVFFGYALDTSGETIHLTRARCAIRFGTTGGFMELAEFGPTAKSKVGARADIQVRDVTSVTLVTEQATAAWEAA